MALAVAEGGAEIGGAEVAAEGVTEAAVMGAGKAAIGGATGAGLLAVAKSAAINFGITYAVASIFAKSPGLANPDAQRFLGNGYSNMDPIPVLYGTRRIGGSRAVLGVRSNPGNSNDVLEMIVIWGEGEVSSLDTLYFDSEPVTDTVGTPSGRYGGNFLLRHYVGTDTQGADSRLIGDLGDPSLWNAFCTLAGIAYSRVIIGWNPDLFPNGRPTITVDYHGRKVYDPRDGTTKYSNNPALVIRDYMTNTRYGGRVASSMIDDTSFISAANTCDEIVSVPNFRLSALAVDAGGASYQAGNTLVLDGGFASRRASIIVDTVDGAGAILTFHISDPGSFSQTNPTLTTFSATSYDTGVADPNGNPTYATGAGATFKSATFTQDSQARYLADGVVNIDQSPLDNLRGLLTSCRGFLVFTGGKWKLKIDKAETPTSFTLDESNIVAAGWSIQGPGKRNRFNRVKCNFFNEGAGFNPDLAIYPQPDQVTGADPVGSAYRTQDGGVLLEGSLSLPFTTNIYRAQQIAMLELKRSRLTQTVSLTATIAATQLEIGDVVPVTHSSPGWVSKLFRVVELELLYEGDVRIGLLEYDATVYSLDTLAIINAVPKIALPDASTAPAPGTPSVVEELYSTTGSAGVKSRANVSWGASASVWVAQGGWYELEYKLTTDTDWTRISPISRTDYSIDDLAAGRYNFRVRAVNSASVHSAYSGTSIQDIYGLTAPPSDPTGFVVQSYAGLAKFIWDKPTANNDLDVVIGGRAFVRFSPRTVGATWQDGSLVNQDGYAGDATIGLGPLMTGTYFLKFRDSNGNYSTNAASFVVTESLITGLSTIATVTEHSTFAGLKTNTVATDGFLKLDAATLWDSISGNIDTWGNIDTEGGVQLTGSYHFASKMDLGSVKSVRLNSTIRSQAFDTSDNWDDRTNNIDDWLSPVDGAVIEDADVELFVRTTDDDPDPPLYMSMNATAGSGATAPDSTLFPTGDIEIIAKIGANDYTPAATRAIFSKAPGAGSANAVNLNIQTSGVVRLITSPDGAAAIIKDSSVSLSSVVADGADVWIKVYRDMDNGAGGNDTYYYWSPDPTTTPWADLGVNPQTNAGTTSIVDSTGLVQWGATGNALAGNNFDGKVHYGEVRNGREGPLVNKFDPTNDADPGASSFTSHTGETYTIVSNAVITGSGAPTWRSWHALGHAADYTARGFDCRLDFTTMDPTHNRQVDQLSVAARQ